MTPGPLGLPTLFLHRWVGLLYEPRAVGENAMNRSLMVILSSMFLVESPR